MAERKPVVTHPAPDSANLVAECGDAWSAAGQSALVVDAAAIGPVQVVHRAVVERRTLTYRYVSAPKGSPTEDALVVDPWALPFDVPTDDESWSERRTLDDQKRAVPCECGTGTETYAIETQSTNGLGQGSVRWDTRTCSRCAGTARVYSIPEVEVELAEHTDSRVLEREELPVNLLIEVGESLDDGDRIFHEQGEALSPRSGGGGAYRDQGPRVSEEVSTIVDQLLNGGREKYAEHGTIHRESIEVLQVPVFRVSFAGGGTGLLYRGKPWKAPRSPALGRATRRALVGAMCLLMAMAIFGAFAVAEYYSK